MSKHQVLTIVALAGTACVAVGQDSTGLNTGDLANEIYIGDALSPYSTDQVITSYVADLAPLDTSWGTRFGVVPLIKSPKSSTNFYNNLVSANGISDDLLTNVGYASPEYSLWVGVPGAGVNPDNNSAPDNIPAPMGMSSQFAAGLSSFGTAGGNSANPISTAIVNYDPAAPNRLYVTRVEAATVVDQAQSGSSGSLAFGSIDANGNVYYRGDSFGNGGAVAAQAGENLYRTRSQDRNAVVNLIDFSGGAEATDRLLFNTGTATLAPSNIPASVSTGNGLVAGSNFNSEFIRGGMAPLTFDSSHFGPEVTEGYTPTDHRGSLGTTTRTLFGTGVATSAILAKDNGVPDDATRVFAVWSTDASGNVVEARSFETPFVVVDPSDGKTVNYTPNSEYSQYFGITRFRSGGGLVGLGQDAAGNGYAGGTISVNGQSFDPIMQNVVVRFGPDGENPEWSILGWVDPITQSGKVIKDGPGGNRVGELASFPLAFPTALPITGPSLSTPTFDGAGNAWFLASAGIDKVDPDTMEEFTDFDVVLIRGVLTEYPGQTPSFGYELELVLEPGDIFDGQNSGVPYQVQFIDLAANSNTNGVLSPAAVDHNNGRTWGWNDTDLSGVPSAAAVTNGGIVLSAEVVYDVDGDGDFEDPTGDAASDSTDQAYASLLYIGYFQDGPTPCNIADISEEFGVLDLSDVSAFVGGFISNDPIADVAEPFGVFDLSDVSGFVAAFTAGCP